MKMRLWITVLFFLVALVFLNSLSVQRVSSLSLDIYDLPKQGSESSQLIREKLWEINQRGLVLKFGEKEFNPSFDEIGAVFNEDELIKKFQSFQKDDIWTKIKRSFNRFLKIKIEIDRAKIKSYLEKIAGDKFVRPINAEVKLKDGEFEIVPGKSGTAISSKLLSAKLKEELGKINDTSLTKKIEIKVRLKKTKPSITEEVLIPRVVEAEYFSKTPFTFQFNDQSYTADPSEVKKWIEFVGINRKVRVEFSEVAINGFLDSIAKKIDIKPKNKVIEVTGDQRKVITEGKEGRALNRDLAIETVKKKLNSLNRVIKLETEVVPPKEIVRYPGNVEGGVYPGKYIEIDVSARQKLRLWEGEKLIATYTISSGKAGYRTPTGHYKVISKNPRAYSSTYGLYMPYWMAFTSVGHGIHELPEWPGGYKEGANHLGTRVSHGCVRLGVGPAAYAYSWAPIGTPVYIHY